jgi:uncharacterized protein (TIGR00255 family)
MTGYGRGTASGGGRQIGVEISSVNRKQLEVALTLPRGWSELEPRLRDEINAQATRGRLTVAVSIHQAGSTTSSINLKAAAAYLKELQTVQKKLGVSGSITLDLVLRGPGVIATNLEDEWTSETWPLLEKALREALKAFVAMRRAEGLALKRDLEKRLKAIRREMERIAKLAPTVLKRHREGLLARIHQAGLSIDANDERLLKELVIFSDRSDVSEEVTRLRSHCDQLAALLTKDESVGRTLDFILQEMNREVNTIGSKANDITISQAVVFLKTELEKIREQVQNVE